jgi:methylated-DNA-[protein]-cysteine S-methyltransferase
MTGNTDIIFAQPLGCYVELTYNTKLNSIRFIKSKNGLKEKKTFKATFELEQYFSGEIKEFSCDVNISELSVFTQKVLDELRKIKYGETITYSGLAKRIGSRAYRAVGRALVSNPIPVIIPCHRVVAKNGVGGYSGGVDIKKRLLELEGVS